MPGEICEAGAEPGQWPAPMLTFLQYLFALMIVQAEETSGGAVAGPDWFGVAMTVVVFALTARLAGVLAARRIHDDDAGAAALPVLLFLANVGRVAAVAAFYLAVHTFGAARIPAAIGIENWLLVPRVVQMVPFLALVAGLSWGLHPLHVAMRAGPRTAGAAIVFELRQALLPLAPVLALAALSDVGRLATQSTSAGRLFLAIENQEALQSLSALAAVFLAILVLPFALRLLWRLKPLPAGPLRDRLTAYSKRTGFRAREILVWPTGGDVLNAAVIGAFPRFRYVIITDGLLKTLPDDEIEAVFAHEAGHARRGHILLFFGFTAVLTLMTVVPGVADVFGAILPRMPGLLRSVLIVLVWFGVVFGWLSRRFEQEADVYGVETVPAPGGAESAEAHPFARALERIGEEAGALREVTGWRHFSIADRVEFVRRYLADESVRRAYRRSIVLLRTTLLTVICGFGLAAAVRVPGEVVRALAKWRGLDESGTAVLEGLHASLGAPDAANRARVLAQTAALAARAGRDAEAVRWMREAVALGEREPEALVAYAKLLERTGRPRGAKLVWRSVADDEKAPSALREEARRAIDGGDPR
jgi:Zn-dependent protease with chaperone function